MTIKNIFWLFSILFIQVACSSETVNQDKMLRLEQVAGISEIKLSDLNIAIQRNRNNSALYARRAMLLQENNKIGSALRDINLAISLNSNKGEYYFQKALILRQTGKISQAQAAAADAEKLGYKGSEVYILQAEFLIRLKKYQEAIEKVNIAIATIPNHEFALFYRGVARAALTDTASAIINFRRAIQSSPKFIHPYLQLASMYNGKKEYDRVLYYVTAAQKLDSQNGFVWYQKGLRFNGMHQTDSAWYSLNKAVQIDPTLYKAHYHLGLISYKRQNYQQAVHHLSKVPMLDQTLPELPEILGVSYEKNGQFRLALQQYSKILRKDPGNVRVQWGIRRSNWGLYKQKRDSLRQAEMLVYPIDTITNYPY